MNLEYTNNLIPKMTSNILPSGEASASSINAIEPNQQPWVAFNHIKGLTAGWHSKNNYGWLQYKFEDPVIINKYTLSPWAGYPHSLPGEWDFLGSNNGEDWVVLDSQFGQTFTEGIVKEYTFANRAKYTHHRIDCKKSVSHSHVVIGELEMMSLVNHSISLNLIKNQNKIYNLLEGSLADITANIINPNDIAQLEYEEYGVDNVSDFPLDELNLMEEFEVLTWSDKHEEIPRQATGTEEVIAEGKLFKTTLDDFKEIKNIIIK